MQTINLLSTQDSGQVFLLALAVVGWVGWGLFALSVLVEIPAQLRGRSAPRVRLLVGQRAAATLVGAILIALPTGTAALASAAPAQAVTAAHTGSPADARAATAASATDTAPSSRETGSVTHHVREARPAQSLWSIAEARLGDGNRWEDIARLNEGRTMTDGSIFRADAPIQPGWILRLPADATPERATTHRPTGAPQTQPGDGTRSTDYTVAPGDDLAGIAARQLGDERKYGEIFALNQGELQPGGHHFTDPDLIYPGQHLDLPAPPPTSPPGSGRAGPPAGPDQHTTAPPEHAKPSTDPASPATTAPSKSAHPTVSPSAAAPAAPSTKPPAPSSAPATTPPTSGATSAPPALGSTGVPSAPPRSAPPAVVPGPATSANNSTDRTVAVAGGVLALLAAGLVGGLGLRRILQQRDRRAGQTIAVEAEPTLLEQSLHASAEPATVLLLDRSLRTMAHHAAASDTPLPDVRGARVTAKNITLAVEDPALDPLPPFTAGGRAGQWVLSSKAPLLDADAAREVPAPYPTLATLGSTADGHLVLTHLVHDRVLLLDGCEEDVLAVGRAMALEATSNAWSDHLDILTLGLGGRLAQLLPQGRLRVMPHVASVVTDLGGLLVEIHQQLTGPDAAPPDPLPWILICATALDTAQAWELADTLAAAAHVPVVAVLPASDSTRRAFPDAQVLPAAPDTAVTLAHLADAPLTVQRISDDAYRSYVHTLQVAAQPAQPATGAWQLAADHNRAATDPRPAPAPVLLQPRGSKTPTAPTGPGTPFPALRAAAGPSSITLLPPPSPDTTPAAPLSSPAPKTPVEDPVVSEAEPPAAATSAEAVEAVEAVEELVDPNGPQIKVLGPIEVTGLGATGHDPKLAALAALIYLRPGKNASALGEAMSPQSPWSQTTVQSRITALRGKLGTNPAGTPYLPRLAGGYKLAPGVRCDLHDFERLATQGLAAGPNGIGPLEDALALVRGRPFDGDYPWAGGLQHDMISRIVDIAHHLATLHTDADSPDLAAARRAVLHGLLADETAEILHRDLFHILFAAGDIPALHHAITRCEHMARANNISLQTLTEQTITVLTADPPRAGRA